MGKPTTPEKIAGSLPTKLAVTGLAAFDGGLLATLLPVLTDSIPARRHERRVKESLDEVNIALKAHEEKIKELSDSQYKLINSAVITMLSTVEDEKLNYLKKVINNAFLGDEIPIHETEIISRWLRDISAEEILFVINNFSFERVAISKPGSYESCLFVDPESRESDVVSGLIAIGILVASGPNLDTIGTYTFSNLTARLIVMLES